MLAGSIASFARCAARVWPLCWSTRTQAVASSEGAGGTGCEAAWAKADAASIQRADRVLKGDLMAWERFIIKGRAARPARRRSASARRARRTRGSSRQDPRARGRSAAHPGSIPGRRRPRCPQSRRPPGEGLGILAAAECAGLGVIGDRCRGGRRRAAGSEALHFDTRGSSTDHVELFRGRARQVDDAALGEGTAVVEPDYDTPPVLEVRHAHPRRQRQRRMRAGHRIHVVGFAGRGAPAVEVRAVPGRDALFDIACGRRQHDVAATIHFIEGRIAGAGARLVA